MCMGGVGLIFSAAALPQARLQCFALLGSADSIGRNFDGVTPPTLPPDWIATNAEGPPPLWVISDSGRAEPAC